MINGKLSTALTASLLTLLMGGTALAQVDVTTGNVMTPEDSTIVGARLGIADVDSLGSTTIGYGAFADYAAATNLLIGATLDYWSSDTGTLLDESVQVDDLSIGANGKLIFTGVDVPFRPFLLVGLAMHRIEVDYATRSGDQHAIDRFRDVYSDSSNEVGIDFGGGILYRIQRAVDVSGEIRYRRLADRRIDLDQLVYSGAVGYLL